jgi:hypothetical protein
VRISQEHFFPNAVPFFFLLSREHLEICFLSVAVCDCQIL